MSSVIDLTILDQLKDMLGDDFVLILESFRDEGSSIIQAIESAASSSDMNQMREAAHSMKSMSGNVGAMNLSELSDQLQIAAANSEAGQVHALWPEVKSQFEQALEELESH